MKIFVAWLAVFFVVGCGEQVSSPPRPVGPPPSLEGKRFSSCYTANGETRLDELGVYKENYEVISRSFQRAGCAGPTMSSRVVARIDAKKQVDAARNLNEIDLSIVSVEIAPLDATIVDLYNRRVHCGFRDWELWRYKNVSGKNCDGVGVAKAGERNFTVYQLRPDESLYLGRYSIEKNGKTPESRPSAVDETRLFVKAAS